MLKKPNHAGIVIAAQCQITTTTGRMNARDERSAGLGYDLTTGLTAARWCLRGSIGQRKAMDHERIDGACRVMLMLQNDRAKPTDRKGKSIETRSHASLTVTLTDSIAAWPDFRKGRGMGCAFPC